MKSILTCLAVCCSLSLCAAKPVNKTFTWSTELKYPFMPKQKMTFINGVVKIPDEVPCRMQTQNTAIKSKSMI